MKKLTYIIINVIAVIIGLFFIIWGSSVSRIIGIIVIFGTASEFFSGRYKKYVSDEITEVESKEERKKLKKMLLPFIILAIVFFIMFLINALKNK